MNRFVNVLMLFLFFPAMVLVILIAFDLPLEFLGTSGSQLTYKVEILGGFAALLLFVHLRRSMQRWMGMNLVSQSEKFLWIQEVSPARMRRVVVYNLLETGIFGTIAIGLYLVTPFAWPLSLCFGIVSLDSLVFLLIGKTKRFFRAGITKNAVVVADRDVTVAYFSGLRRVHRHQESLFFEYIKGVQLFFPMDCLQKEHEEDFYRIMQDQVDPEKVFITQRRQD